MKRVSILVMIFLVCVCGYANLLNAEDVVFPDSLNLETLISSNIIITGEVLEGGGIPGKSDKLTAYAKVKIIQVLKGDNLPSIISIKYFWFVYKQEYIPIEPNKKYLFFLEKEKNHYILAFQPERIGAMGASGPYELSGEYDFYVGIGKESKWKTLTTKEVIKIIRNKYNSFKNYLPKDFSKVLGYTWNEKKVTGENCRTILDLLNKFSFSFEERERDVRFPTKGPIMQLAPTAYFGFKHDSKEVRVELYSFTEMNRVVQVVFKLEKEYYFSSRENELISEIEQIEELK